MTSANLHFELPKALVLNSNDRKHHHVNAPVVRNLRAMGKRAATGSTPMQQTRLVVRIGWPDKRRRDAPNLWPTVKPLVDGAVDSGLLQDDSDDYILSTTFEGYVARKPGIVVLDLEFRAVA